VGLDVVELVLRVEEEFEVEFSDDEAAAAATVGGLYNLVLDKLRRRVAPSSLDAEKVWRKLHWIVVDQLQVRDDEVVPSARLNEDLGAD
jgi:acyl carrier protein